VSSGFDAPAQARRGVDLVGRALEEREGAFLLGEPSRELRRRGHLRLERFAAVRCERFVRKRRQRGDVLVSGMTSRGHGTTNASSLTESLFTF
jgi:hypothetical protein